MKLTKKINLLKMRGLGCGMMRGMTLLELTVVIMVLLALISVLFVGAQAWKRGSDRALCIINIQQVQKGVRSFSNLYGHSPGEGVPGLQMRVIGLGKFVESSPSCPSAGSYTYGPTFGADTIPPVGEVYLKCSLATSGHVPSNVADW
ncbi:MAG: type II secretion system protein [Armatimonadetes bacterium]|nr:type II secretion system protein [Akkermansiaceae bacterium]